MLLEGQVEAPRPSLDARAVKDPVRQGGLQAPRGPGDQDNGTRGDAALDVSIEPRDVGADAVPQSLCLLLASRRSLPRYK